jgi:hypothetical protein
VIPEIDIWRAANLMLKRYGEKALKESAARADELESRGDYDGAATWRRITVAVGQFENKMPTGPSSSARDRDGNDHFGVISCGRANVRARSGQRRATDLEACRPSALLGAKSGHCLLIRH